MVLFLVALLLPTAVLVMLGLRMIDQERTVAEAQATGELQQAVGRIRQHLLGTLERIKREELAALAPGAARAARHAHHPDVELVTWVEDGRVVLPWDARGGETVVRGLLQDVAFAGWLRQGERAEHRRGDHRTAIEAYGRALELAEHPTQAGYARLALARTLAGAGRDDDAWTQYRQVAALPADAVDEHGIPLAFYAARRLVDGPRDLAYVLDRLRAEVDTSAWMAPAAAHLSAELLDALAGAAPDSTARASAAALRDAVARRIPVSERALALQRDYAGLGLHAPSPVTATAQPLWVPFGEGTWLVSAGRPAGTPSEVAIAVNAAAVFAQLDSAVWPARQRGQVRVRAPGEERGVPLGAGLAGLEVEFPFLTDVEAGRVMRRWFYALALSLILSVTFFGAAMAWRDVRRELRLAGLRSQFVSSVSHELKTPLTSIRMFAEILQTTDPPDPHRLADYLGTIVGESERLTRLLNNVLDLSRIEQDHLIYRPRPTSLAEVTQRAVQAMEYPLKQEGCTLRLHGADALPPVLVDPDALEQAVLNLLSNAIKYSGERREIDVRLKAEHGYGVIEVTDRGPGIPAHALKHLTQKFYRVPTPENQRVPGTGLGLTLVDHMVRAHGGELRVHSVVGEGSTFAIRLPVGGKG